MAARLIAEFHDAMKRAEESTARFMIERGQALLVDNKRHLCARSPCRPYPGSPLAAECPVMASVLESTPKGACCLEHHWITKIKASLSAKDLMELWEPLCGEGTMLAGPRQRQHISKATVVH